MPKHCGTLDERVGYRRLLRKWGAAAQDHCFAAVPSCGCQTRKDDECDAEASGRSSDAATTAIAAVPGRNPPVPFGFRLRFARRSRGGSTGICR